MGLGSGEYVVWISNKESMSDPVSRYRQRLAAQRAEVVAGTDELLAAQGSRRASAETSVATRAEEANAWLRASIDTARRRGMGRGGGTAADR
jgi:hypothetical protein